MQLSPSTPTIAPRAVGIIRSAIHFSRRRPTPPPNGYIRERGAPEWVTETFLGAMLAQGPLCDAIVLLVVVVVLVFPPWLPRCLCPVGFVCRGLPREMSGGRFLRGAGNWRLAQNTCVLVPPSSCFNSRTGCWPQNSHACASAQRCLL